MQPSGAQKNTGVDREHTFDGAVALPVGPAARSDSEEGFEAARAQTLQALGALSAHWRVAEVRRHGWDEASTESIPEAVDRVLNDPEALSLEGFAWSREAGLAFVLPSGALQCRPLARSLGADGLSISMVGGPVVQTLESLIVAPAPPCGFGVFATMPIRKGESLGEYLGIARSYDIWLKEIEDAKIILRGSKSPVPFICNELYAAWTGEGPEGAGTVVDAFAAGNAMRFVNCSCDPNVTFEQFGLGPEQHYRLEVVALRDIEAWEQIAVDYGWYHDDDTLRYVRSQAIRAFNQDVADLGRLGAWLCGQQSAAQSCPAEEISCSKGASSTATRAAALGVEPVPRLLVEGRPQDGDSEALRALAHAIDEARGLPQHQPPSFLRRFIIPEAVASLLEASGPCFVKVDSIHNIPGALWPMYEVVGGVAVGVPCRCGLGPSLNAGGRCSGIIGRPLQTVYDGRTDDIQTFSW